MFEIATFSQQVLRFLWRTIAVSSRVSIAARKHQDKVNCEGKGVFHLTACHLSVGEVKAEAMEEH